LLDHAGLGKRLGAILYDSLLVLAIWFLTLAFVAMVSDSSSALDQVIPATYVQIICGIETFAFFYFFWMHRGRTLGMMAWHTHLATVSGETLKPTHVCLRIIGAILNFATLGLGYLWILLDNQNRSFSDMLSGTCILED